MSQCSLSRNAHWSEDHQWFLAAIAKTVYSRFPPRHFIHPNDLIDEAWLQCLRHRPKDKLRGCARICELTMADYAIAMLSGQSRYMRQHCQTRVESAGLLTTDLIDQYGGQSDRTPLEICIEREENSLKCLHRADDIINLGKRPARL